MNSIIRFFVVVIVVLAMYYVFFCVLATILGSTLFLSPTGGWEMVFIIGLLVAEVSALSYLNQEKYFD